MDGHTLRVGGGVVQVIGQSKGKRVGPRKTGCRRIAYRLAAVSDHHRAMGAGAADAGHRHAIIPKGVYIHSPRQIREGVRIRSIGRSGLGKSLGGWKDVNFINGEADRGLGGLPERIGHFKDAGIGSEPTASGLVGRAQGGGAEGQCSVGGSGDDAGRQAVRVRVRGVEGENNAHPFIGRNGLVRRHRRRDGRGGGIRGSA